MDSLFEPILITIGDIKNKWKGCKTCYFSVGTPCMPNGSNKAEVLILGQWPGQEDMKSGIPFSGAQGKVCKDYLYKVGFKEIELFFTNTLLCTAPVTPSKEILTNCFDQVEEVISIVKPILIITLGSIAKKRLGGPEDKDYFLYKGKAVCSCIHPAILARTHDQQEKKRLESQLIFELQTAYAMFTQQRKVNGSASRSSC